MSINNANKMRNKISEELAKQWHNRDSAEIKLTEVHSLSAISIFKYPYAIRSSEQITIQKKPVFG